MATPDGMHQDATVVMTHVAHVAKKENGEKWVNEYVRVRTSGAKEDQCKIARGGLLGKGSYGKVCLYRNASNGKIYAVKVLNKRLLAKIHLGGQGRGGQVCGGSSALDSVLSEIETMRRLKVHAAAATGRAGSLSCLIEVIDDPNRDKLYLVMEHAGIPFLDYFRPSPDLTDSVSLGEGQSSSCHRLGAAECICVLQQALLALCFLHDLGIVHGDVKPDHLLVDPECGRVTLVDLGSCTDFCLARNGHLSFDGVSKSPGTPAYTAPECCGSTAAGSIYSGRKADVWALGMAIYVAFYGAFPFRSCNAGDMYEEIRVTKEEDLFPRQAQQTLDEDVLVLTDALKQMLTRDPDRRPLPSQLLDRMMAATAECNNKDSNPTRQAHEESRSVDEIEREFARNLSK